MVSLSLHLVSQEVARGLNQSALGVPVTSLTTPTDIFRFGFSAMAGYLNLVASLLLDEDNEQNCRARTAQSSQTTAEAGR
jgi:hypothetical protein